MLTRLVSSANTVLTFVDNVSVKSRLPSVLSKCVFCTSAFGLALIFLCRTGERYIPLIIAIDALFQALNLLVASRLYVYVICKT